MTKDNLSYDRSKKQRGEKLSRLKLLMIDASIGKKEYATQSALIDYAVTQQIMRLENMVQEHKKAGGEPVRNPI